MGPTQIKNILEVENEIDLLCTTFYIELQCKLDRYLRLKSKKKKKSPPEMNSHHSTKPLVTRMKMFIFPICSRAENLLTSPLAFS